MRPLLVGDGSPLSAELGEERLADGTALVRLELAGAPTPLALVWRVPLTDAACLWTTGAGRDKGLPPSWAPLRLNARATAHAPLLCVVSGSGENRLTLACSDLLHPIELTAGVVEETGELEVRVGLFGELGVDPAHVDLAVRIDRRPVRYEQALEAAASWWASLPDCAPIPVPAAAREPMLSTWYAFHQELDPGAVEAECRRAHDLGMSAEPQVIVTAEIDQVIVRHHAPRAPEVALLEVGERRLQRCRVALHAAPGRAGACECAQSGPCTCGASPDAAPSAATSPGGVKGTIPSRVSSARSRATSGLPVVRSFSP